MDPATIGALVMAAGGLASGFMGGQDSGGGLEDADKDLMRAMWGQQHETQRMGNDWLRFAMPYSQQTMSGLNPLLLQTIQQRIQNPGLPKGLENSIWQLARQRLGNSFGGLGTQMGEMAASRGTLGSGAVMNSWLDKVGLARNQAEQQLATDRALANYQAQQQAIQEGMQMLGGVVQPPMGGQMPTAGAFAQQNQAQPTDWAGLGSLFAKGLGGLGGGSAGRQPGTAQVANMGNVTTAPKNYYLTGGY